MNFIEAFGLLARLMNHLHRANAKTGARDAIDYFSGVTRSHGVGFDDSEGSVVRHRFCSYSAICLDSSCSSGSSNGRVIMLSA
jgi:hypothetical protein